MTWNGYTWWQLRVFGCHIDDKRMTRETVKKLRDEENYGLSNIKIYRSFQAKADRAKNDLIEFLIEQKKLGKKVVGYGAAAKGNTLLNYAGIKTDLPKYDASISKQGNICLEAIYRSKRLAKSFRLILIMF